MLLNDYLESSWRNFFDYKYSSLTYLMILFFSSLLQNQVIKHQLSSHYHNRSSTHIEHHSSRQVLAPSSEVLTTSTFQFLLQDFQSLPLTTSLSIFLAINQKPGIPSFFFQYLKAGCLVSEFHDSKVSLDSMSRKPAPAPRLEKPLLKYKIQRRHHRGPKFIFELLRYRKPA
jgi:hypothetical protein